MKFCKGMYRIMKDKVSSLKHMEELLEDIMLEEQLHRKSYELGYDGQLCTKIPRNIVEHMMFVRGLGICRKGMSCL